MRHKSASNEDVRLPGILTKERQTEALGRIKEYFHTSTEYARTVNFGPTVTTIPSFTGSEFDTFGREEGDEDRVTPSDLLSLALLSVPLRGDAVLGILRESSAEITDLLRQLPKNKDLHVLSSEEFLLLHDDDEPSVGQMLWDILRSHHLDTTWDMGPTRVSKLLARKRPLLIPIWDELIGTALGLKDSRGHWIAMYSLLRETEGLPDHLSSLRDEAGLDRNSISILRIFDVAVWHAQKYPQWRPPAA